MGKFSLKGNKGARTITRNLAGGVAYQLGAKQEAVTHVLTSFMKDSFYRTEQDATQRLADIISSVPALFAAKLAVMARRTYGMRSVSHFIAAFIADRVSGTEWGSSFYERVVYRPDDMCEICAAYFYMNPNKGITNAMKKGFRAVFGRLTEYDMAKYRGEGHIVSLVDVMRLCHAVPTQHNADALKKLVKGTLRSFDTWESALSAAGQVEGDVESAKAEVWRYLLESGKLGYFALLRNLSNIAKQAPECVDIACAMLTDKYLIQRSLVLPFRYMTAYDQLTGIPRTAKLQGAIAEAMDICLSNIPPLPGHTLIALDVSGSMRGKPLEIGTIFAAALAKSLNQHKGTSADLLTFDNTTKYEAVSNNRSVLDIAKSINFRNGGTNFECIFHGMKTDYDRIFILSDMQGWMEGLPDTYMSGLYKGDSLDKVFKRWCKENGRKPILYSFDLAGYGTGKFKEKDVFLMSGFSEKIFDLLPELESGQDSLVERVEEVVL